LIQDDDYLVKVIQCVLPGCSELVVALGAEPAVASRLDFAFIGAIATTDETIAVVVVGAFA
jgi:hypothetical protein